MFQYKQKAALGRHVSTEQKTCVDMFLRQSEFLVYQCFKRSKTILLKQVSREAKTLYGRHSNVVLLFLLMISSSFHCIMRLNNKKSPKHGDNKN
jgi:hypothetical protein